MAGRAAARSDVPLVVTRVALWKASRRVASKRTGGLETAPRPLRASDGMAKALSPWARLGIPSGMDVPLSEPRQSADMRLLSQEQNKNK